MDRHNSEDVIVKKPAVPLASADKVAFWVLMIGILLLPFIFYPIPGASIVVVKKFFLLGVTLTTFLFWLIGRIQEGVFKIPISSITFSLFLLPLSFLVSALFSGSIRHSIIGAFYQPETVLSVFSLWVLTFLVVEFFSDRHRLFNLYVAFCVSGLAFGLYLITRFLLGPVLPANIINLLPISLMGSWYENGIMFGLVVIVSVLMLEFLVLEKARLLKILLTTTIGVSLLCLILINYSTVWAVIGFLSLIIFVFFAFLNKDLEPKNKRILLRPSSIVLLVSVLFFMIGGTNGIITESLNSLYNNFQFSFLEVRPGLSSTVDVVKGVARDQILFGVGPNNFSNAWTLYRSKFVNESPYWNVSFNNAFGIIPTYVVMAGAIGIIALLVFFGSLVYGLFKVVIASGKDPEDILGRLLYSISGIGAVYAWIMVTLYTPNAFGLPIAFVMTGLFVATMAEDKLIKTKVISFTKNQKNYFISMCVLGVFFIGTLILDYSLIQKFRAVVIYGHGTVALASGNIEEANLRLMKALNADDKNPLYLRTFTGLKLQELNNLLTQGNVEDKEVSIKVQSLIETAVTSSQQAVNLNPLDYQNLQVLAGVYEFLASMNIAQAYETSKDVYQQALVLNPNNPDLLLNMARLEIGQNNFDEARELLEQALTVKTNYTSSVVVLSQLDTEDGNTKRAISRLEEALVNNPYDTTLLFQLGLLRYQSGDYISAIDALKDTITFSQGGVNANASYFLGLSYAENGQRTLAIEQFEIIQSFNPDNAEVDYILSNLKAGRSALSGLGSGQNAPSVSSSDTVDSADIEAVEVIE